MRNKLCRLCLQSVPNDEFETLYDVKLSKLKFLSISLNVSPTVEPVICSKCSENLNCLFNFKTTCLSNNNRFKTYRSSETLHINLGVKNDNSKIKNEENKLCRLCLKQFKVNLMIEIQSDMSLTNILEKCLSEVDLNITENPLACHNCVEFLQKCFNFITTCADNEEYFLSHLNNDDIRNETENEEINDYMSDKIIVENNEKLERMENENPVEYEKYNNIKVEYGKINDCDSDSLEIVKKEVSEDIEGENENFSDNESDNLSIVKEELFNININELKGHIKEENLNDLEEKYEESVFDSDSLEETEYASSSNYIIHTEYTCIMCTFQSPRKLELKKHYLLHENPLKKKLYNCSKCGYLTEFLSHFMRHEIKHKGPLETKMHKCSECTYQTKYKNNLRSHFKARHDGVPDLYKCNDCSYTTKVKVSMKLHRRRHMATAQRKCDYCNYKTKSSYWLKKHMEKFKSKDASETYKCNQCDFVTPHRCVLMEHCETHDERKKPSKNDIEATRIFKCRECGYFTDIRCNLDQHVITHLDPADITMYKCTECPFQTKYKPSVKKHFGRCHPYVDSNFKIN